MSAISAISQPFTNVQIELLKVFAHQVSDNDLRALKELLVKFFAERAIAAADIAWEKNGWTNTDVDRLLNTKLRKSQK